MKSGPGWNPRDAPRLWGCGTGEPRPLPQHGNKPRPAAADAADAPDVCRGCGWNGRGRTGRFGWRTGRTRRWTRWRTGRTGRRRNCNGMYQTHANTDFEIVDYSETEWLIEKY